MYEDHFDGGWYGDGRASGAGNIYCYGCGGGHDGYPEGGNDEGNGMGRGLARGWSDSGGGIAVGVGNVDCTGEDEAAWNY